MADADTIAAIATPPGMGGVGIVRVSGPRVRAIAQALLGRLPPVRRATFAVFREADGTPLDEGLVLFFAAPHSFTGEDVLELHGHGGPVVMDLLLRRVLALGARPARPGEFSERAFLNDRLDLVQAEAIADLIASGSEQAARAALRSLRGEFSRVVQALVERLTELRTYIEAAIDFPDEEVDFLAAGAVAGRLAELLRTLDELTVRARQGALLQQGLTVVIAGRPNAGKSSLLNALAGYEAAIVTDIPGTTRDVLRERVHIDGLPLHVIDTAGLRESGDVIEREGMRRARAELERADRVLLVIDDLAGFGVPEETILAALPPALPVTFVWNKCDASGRAPRVWEEGGRTQIALSARTGAGLDLLRAHLKQAIGFQQPGADTLMARRRHLEALTTARQHLETAVQVLAEARAGELVAEELRLAQRALGEITGEVTSEDLLARIFATFCIGK